MTRVRVATWNVNSIRARIDRVAAWLERSDVDVLAIQETKIDGRSVVLPRRLVKAAKLGLVDLDR